MTAKRRWTIWLSLLTATLVAANWVSREPDSDSTTWEQSGLRVQPRGSAVDAEEEGGEAKSSKSTVLSNSVTAAAPAANPFDTRSWYVPPPPLPPPQEVIARPVAPPLPFRYLGTLETGEGQWLVQLAKGNEGIIAAKGDVIDDLYRLEELQQGDLVFTYLPLGTRQLLPTILDSD